MAQDMNAIARNRPTIWVVGMHRSGTSLLTRVLRYLGANAGPEDTHVKPTKWNPAGLFELEALVQVNDSFLQSLYCTWYDSYVFDLDRVPADDLSRGQLQVKALHASICAASPCTPVFKDPRLCLTIPAFVQKQDRVVLVVRDPLAVALSVDERDRFGLPVALALWEMYNVRASKNLKDSQPLVISYDNLLESPRQEIRRIAEHVSGVIPVAVERERHKRASEIVRGRARHSTIRRSDFVLPWHEDKWDQLRSNRLHAVCKDGVSPHSVALLHMLRRLRLAQH